MGEEIPKVRFVGLQPENSSSRSAWLELENYDSTSVDLNDFCLKWTAVDSARIKNVTLSSGKKLKICFLIMFKIFRNLLIQKMKKPPSTSLYKQYIDVLYTGQTPKPPMVVSKVSC